MKHKTSIFNSFINLHCLSKTLIISLSLVLSNGEDVNYSACSILYSCGQIQNVGYPFWGDNRPEFCGISDLKLSCQADDNYPTIILSGNRFVGLSVIEINTSFHTISLSLENLLTKCHLQAKFRSRNIKPTFKLAKNYTKIDLFNGCKANCASKYKSKSFTCYNHDEGTNARVYYFGNNSSDTSRIGKLCSCDYNFSSLVDETGLDELKSSSYDDDSSLLSILTKRPIKVEYLANFTACKKCLESGGRCGSSEGSSSDFLCHCVDGPHPLVCHQSSIRRKLTILGTGASALIVGTLVAIVICGIKQRKINKFSFIGSRRTKRDQNVELFLKSYGSLAPKRYTYANIKKITNTFKDKLGEGGYGSVYKGKLNDGRFVAVKKLKFLKGDGKDFINEVLSMSRTSHVNIVTLLGFCFEANKRALVFEFLPNGSLEKFMYGKETRKSLQWETKFNIAIGIARGLDYLHRGCNTQILHFDIKPHNILLDENFCPKISDFGLARLCPPTNSMISMSEARGTVGYIAPEVFCRNFGGVSHKSDVYSYGMMLLDIVCGRENTTNDVQYSSEEFFPKWIYDQFESREGDYIDEILNDTTKKLEKKMTLVSLWCIQAYPTNRPPINRVVEMLEGPLESIQMPPKPYISSPAYSVFDSSSMITA